MSIQTRPAGQGGTLREAADVLERPLRVEVEPELGQLDRDLAVELAFAMSIEQPEVVVRDGIRLLAPRDVLAEPSEHRRDALGLERVGGCEGRGSVLAGHEPEHGPSGEPELRQPFAQPAVAGHPQEDRSHPGEDILRARRPRVASAR